MSVLVGSRPLAAASCCKAWNALSYGPLARWCRMRKQSSLSSTCAKQASRADGNSLEHRAQESEGSLLLSRENWNVLSKMFGATFREAANGNTTHIRALEDVPASKVTRQDGKHSPNGSLPEGNPSRSLLFQTCLPLEHNLASDRQVTSEALTCASSANRAMRLMVTSEIPTTDKRAACYGSRLLYEDQQARP